MEVRLVIYKSSCCDLTTSKVRCTWMIIGACVHSTTQFHLRNLHGTYVCRVILNVLKECGDKVSMLNNGWQIERDTSIYQSTDISSYVYRWVWYQEKYIAIFDISQSLVRKMLINMLVVLRMVMQEQRATSVHASEDHTN